MTWSIADLYYHGYRWTRRVAVHSLEVDMKKKEQHVPELVQSVIDTMCWPPPVMEDENHVTHVLRVTQSLNDKLEKYAVDIMIVTEELPYFLDEFLENNKGVDPSRVASEIRDIAGDLEIKLSLTKEFSDSMHARIVELRVSDAEFYSYFLTKAFI